MQPKKERIRIDARAEKIKELEIKELRYTIANLQDQKTWQTIYQAIGNQVLSLAVREDQLVITYETNKISPTFIEYLLRQWGIGFQPA
ncbi:MAG: hypothetical protein APF84_08635 [Gracilibacter sp. BRH_c7a]|nr:MAG: hypothetical protein APF84_08635 [Gracilibacter sp. BRH_c7a]